MDRANHRDYEQASDEARKNVDPCVGVHLVLPGQRLGRRKSKVAVAFQVRPELLSIGPDAEPVIRSAEKRLRCYEADNEKGERDVSPAGMEVLPIGGPRNVSFPPELFRHVLRFVLPKFLLKASKCNEHLHKKYFLMARRRYFYRESRWWVMVILTRMSVFFRISCDVFGDVFKSNFFHQLITESAKCLHSTLYVGL